MSRFQQCGCIKKIVGNAEDRCHVALIGAGIAQPCCRQLVRRYPWIRVVFLDKERKIASSDGHNSGVLHSGLIATPARSKRGFASKAGSDGPLLRWAEQWRRRYLRT